MSISAVRRPFSAAFACTLVFSLVLIAGLAGDADARTRKPGKAVPPAAVAAVVPSRLPGPARMFAIRDLPLNLDGTAPAANGTASVAPGTGVPIAVAAPAGPSRSSEPFGFFTLRAPPGLAWVKWRGVEADMAVEREVVARCRVDPGHCTSPAAIRFIALVEDARRRVGRARLEAVNRAVNAALRYVSDLEQHGVPDLWSAPLASLAAGAGDCEDYAIAKYEVLRAAGVAAEDLRLLLGRDASIGEDHAVLAVREPGLSGQPDLSGQLGLPPGQNAQWLILDNRNATVIADAEMTTFVPIFAIGQHGVELFAVRRVDH